uniref:hypothetical protein n=1 Tax=Alistipes sp. TaxID=1872444 RepID=UPI004056F103
MVPYKFLIKSRDAIAMTIIASLLIFSSCTNDTTDSFGDNPNTPPPSEDVNDNTIPAPYIVSATMDDKGAILSWEFSQTADYFYFYVSTSKNGQYEYDGRIKGSSRACYVNTEYDNNVYYYKMTAVCNDEESNFSNVVKVRMSSGGNSETAPSAPSNVTAENYGNSYSPEIRISWNSVSNATSYIVYRSSSSSSGYSEIGTTYNTYYNDYYPNSGNNYYKVKAVNSAGKSGYSSYAVYNYDTSSSLTPGTPNVSVSGSSTLTISWSCPTGSGYGKATSYEVYKRNPETAEYDLLKTTSSTSYTDSNTHPGVNRYAVIAVNSAGSSNVGYGYSNEVSLSRPSSFSASKSGSNVKFSWSKVSKATGYQIYYSTSASGSYYILEEIDDVNTTSKTVYYPASSGTKMYFKIRAYWSAYYGGSPIYSDFSSYKTVTF